MTNSSRLSRESPWPPPGTQRPGNGPAGKQTVTIVDAVIGILGWVALIGVGSLAVFYSLFFAMATDSCFTGSQCREDLVGSAMSTVWVGVAISWLIALIGTVVSLVKRRMFFYWPLIGVALVAVSVWIGLTIIGNVNPQ